MPKVSIILPVYNKEEYLPAAFNSLLNQSYQDWELIVVDDGSTDTSGEIIEHFARQDPRITSLSQENRGVSAARNSGLSKAAGEVIADFKRNEDKFSKRMQKDDCYGFEDGTTERY